MRQCIINEHFETLSILLCEWFTVNEASILAPVANRSNEILMVNQPPANEFKKSDTKQEYLLRKND